MSAFQGQKAFMIIKIEEKRSRRWNFSKQYQYNSKKITSTFQMNHMLL